MVRKKVLISGGLMKSVNIPDAVDVGTTITGYAGQSLTVAQLKAVLGIVDTVPNTQVPTGGGGGTGGSASLVPAPGLVGGGSLVGTVPLRVNRAQAAFLGAGGNDEGSGGSGPPGKRGRDGAAGGIGPTGPAGTPGGPRGYPIALVTEPADPPSPILVRGPRGLTGPQGPAGGGSNSHLKLWLPDELPDPPMFVGRAKPGATATVVIPVPATISDLQYWFQADAPLMSSGKAYNALANSAPNTSGVVAVGSGATRSATLINGRGVSAFPGTAASLYTLNAGLTLTAGATIFVVWQAANAATTNGSPFVSGPSGCLELRMDNSTNTLSLLKGQIANIGTSSGSLTAGTTYQFNATYDGSAAYAFRIARTASGSGSSAQSITALSTGIGSDPGSGAPGDLNGLLGELIVYNRVLTGTEVTTIEAYLLAKWGV